MAQDNDRDFGLSPEIERLSAQLARDPNSKLFIPLAEEYMKADMAQEAVMTLEEGLKAHPAYMSARVLLGKAHLMTGDMDKACEQFENVIKAVPDNLFALKKLGEIYLAQGRREESLKNFRILALLSPKDEELSSLIGQLESGQLPPSPLAAAKPAQEVPPAEQAPEPGQGESTPEPEPAQPSTFDLGSDVPYQAGDSEALDLDRHFSGGEETPEDQAGFYELEPDAGAEREGEEKAAAEAMPRGPRPGDELQAIFASYGGEEGQEVASEQGAGVYELEEPSDIDFEELGVKTPMASPAAAEGAGADYASGMPFDMEGGADATVPSGMAFDLAEEGLDESPFEGAAPNGAGAGGDLPFDIMAGEEAGLDEMPFDAADVLDMDADAPFEVEPETGAEPFEAEAAPDMEPEAEAEAFEPGDTFGEFEPGPEPIAIPSGEAYPRSQEPIRTETLAEMYIRQGFYDRAINIYKEMLRESPGDMTLKQKLEELYMLAGMDSERSVSEKAAGSADWNARVEPADFVAEAQGEEGWAGVIESSQAGEPQAAPLGGDGRDVVGRLEEFLENIRRKGRR